VGLALPVRRQRGTGHRGGAVLVPAAPQAEIDTHAPSARCAAAHCGVLLTTADHAVGSQCPPYASLIALPLAMPLEPLLAHRGPYRRPVLLDAGRAAAGFARSRRTPGRRAPVACCGPGRAHRRRLGRVIAQLRCRSPGQGRSSRALCRRAGCPRHVARDARAIVSMGAHAAGSTMDTTRLLPRASSIVCNPPVTTPCSFCSNQVLVKAAGTTTHANSPTRPTPRYIA